MLLSPHAQGISVSRRTDLSALICDSRLSDASKLILKRLLPQCAIAAAQRDLEVFGAHVSAGGVECSLAVSDISGPLDLEAVQDPAFSVWIVQVLFH